MAEKRHKPEPEQSDYDPVALDAASLVFTHLRAQNVELAKVALQVAGAIHPSKPIAPGEMRATLERAWEVYSELYEWVDPEHIEDDGDE